MLIYTEIGIFVSFMVIGILKQKWSTRNDLQMM